MKEDDSFMETKIVRKGQGEILLEGQECSEIYFRTDKLVFTISTLLPGQQACLDRGHEGSDEVCYVISGTIVMHLPEKKEYHLLNKGDAICIPPGEPHYSVNVGKKQSITAWSCAPHL
ncbi:MAG: cupin domain-containing protein [Actinobacteria bacterium]|nr:cupin domain-containing protein [Actinomycetota bacterium]